MSPFFMVGQYLALSREDFRGILQDSGGGSYFFWFQYAFFLPVAWLWVARGSLSSTYSLASFADTTASSFLQASPSLLAPWRILHHSVGMTTRRPDSQLWGRGSGRGSTKFLASTFCTVLYTSASLVVVAALCICISSFTSSSGRHL